MNEQNNKKPNYVHWDMPFEHYLEQTQCINATALKAGRTSLKHMHMSMLDTVGKETPPIVKGRRFHEVVEQGPSFLSNVRTWDEGPRRGRAWEAFKEESDTLILKPEEIEECQQLWDGFKRIAGIKELLGKDPRIEPSFFWEGDTYGKAKCRLDFFTKSKAIVEYKTTANIQKGAFTSQAWRLGYHLQAAWMSHGVSLVLNRPFPVPVYFVVQESKPPFDGYILRVLDSTIEWSLNVAMNLATRYRECEKEGHFPGHLDEITEYELPTWASNELAGGTGNWWEENE